MLSNPNARLIDRKVWICIAKSSLQCVEEGNYEADGSVYDIKDAVSPTNHSTRYCISDSELSQWPMIQGEWVQLDHVMGISVMECFALEGHVD